MKKQQGVNVVLKVENPMRLLQIMNNIHNNAEEVVPDELI